GRRGPAARPRRRCRPRRRPGRARPPPRRRQPAGSGGPRPPGAGRGHRVRSRGRAAAPPAGRARGPRPRRAGGCGHRCLIARGLQACERGGRAVPSIAGGRGESPGLSPVPRPPGPRSARPALAPDLLVELDPVALLGRLAALLPPHPADLAEEVVAVALLGRLATLASGLGSAHLLRFRHPTTSSPIRLPW